MKKILSIIALGCSISVSAQTYTLEQLKDAALRNNITVRNAQRSVEAAQQQRKEAFTKYFPNVSGTGLWFNANKGMAQTTVNPSEIISPEIGSFTCTDISSRGASCSGQPHQHLNDEKRHHRLTDGATACLRWWADYQWQQTGQSG